VGRPQKEIKKRRGRGDVRKTRQFRREWTASQCKMDNRKWERRVGGWRGGGQGEGKGIAERAEQERDEAD
jgi:hypothetical protein